MHCGPIFGVVLMKILAELRWAASGVPYSYGKEKETHQLIFSWARTHDHDHDDGVAQDDSHTPNRHAALVYHLLHGYWTSML